MGDVVSASFGGPEPCGQEARRSRRGVRGQAMVELGIVIVLFMLLVLGIIEFGRILMITNVVTHAARDGARAAAVVAQSGRDATGMITNKTPIENLVKDQIRNVTDDPFNVVVSQAGGSGTVPTVTVQVTGAVPYLFGTFLFSNGATSLNVNRSVTFRDEGR